MKSAAGKRMGIRERIAVTVIATLSIFLLSTASSAATFTTEYNFAGNPDASTPVRNGLVMATSGCLYGISQAGGVNNAGAIFRSTPQGRESVIYSFAGGADGASPTSILIGSNGNLYGTTLTGGSSGNGTVWMLAASGGSCDPTTGTLTTLYSFGAGTDGGNPGNLVQGTDGNLYGTTPNGGTGPRQLGTVFKIAPDGSEFTTFYSFTGRYANDGEDPTSLIRGSDGNLYGTANGGDSRRGAGAVFRLTLAGVETVTHKFGGNYHNGSGDGIGPNSLTQGTDGNLYGTTAAGNLPSNGGTLFVMAPDGTAFSTLYGFQGADDGLTPTVVLLKNSSLYGLTGNGGTYNSGSIFRFAAGIKSIVYSFTGGADGAQPLALIPGIGSAFFGTTSMAGNSSNNGTLFRVILQ